MPLNEDILHHVLLYASREQLLAICCVSSSAHAAATRMLYSTIDLRTYNAVGRLLRTVRQSAPRTARLAGTIRALAVSVDRKSYPDSKAATLRAGVAAIVNALPNAQVLNLDVDISKGRVFCCLKTRYCLQHLCIPDLILTADILETLKQLPPLESLDFMLRPNQRGVLLAAQWLAHILSSQHVRLRNLVAPSMALSIGLTLRTLNTGSTDSANSTTTYRSVRHISLVSLVKWGYPEVGFTHEMAQAFPNVSYIRSDDRPTAGLETSLANLRYLQIPSDFPPAQIFLSSPFLSALALTKPIGSDFLRTWSSPQLTALRVEHDLDMDASTTVALMGELFPELRSLDACVAVQRPTELQQVFKSHNPCRLHTQEIHSTLPKLKSLTIRWKTSARSDVQIINLDAVKQLATSHPLLEVVRVCQKLVNYNAAVGINMTRFWNYMAWRVDMRNGQGSGDVRSVLWSDACTLAQLLVPSLAGILPPWYQDEAFA